MGNTRIAVSEIHIAGDILPKDTEVQELATSIHTMGLMYPIAVMECDEGGYVVIIGEGRFLALKSLGATSIPVEVLTMDDAGEMLAQEVAVRVLHGEITIAQRLSYANRIEAVEKKKASFRKRLNRSLAVLSSVSVPDGGGKESLSDIVARKAGFTSATQMRRAMDIARNRPDLLDAIDRGEYTIHGAHDVMKVDALKSTMRAGTSASAGAATNSGVEVANAGPHSTGGADYRGLQAEYAATLRELRETCDALCNRCEDYEKRLRAYTANAERGHNEQLELVHATRRSVFEAD